MRRLNLRSLELAVLDDGEFITDAGELMGGGMKARIRGAMHPVLVETGGELVLLDAGFGPEIPDTLKEKYELRRKKTLPQNVEEAGYSPQDVTRIVLSHLDADHVGWAIRSDAFPEATVYAQRAALEEARSLPEGSGRGEAAPELERLAGRYELLEGGTEIAPGVRAELREGHAGGHQVFWLGEDEALFTADLAPARIWLDPDLISSADTQPELSRENRVEVLGRASELGIPVILYHEPEECVVEVRREGEGFTASPYGD